ncbi:MAG: hypothetical protein WC325_08420 [Candidatus Bathyarchaeia archaeon]|jgi:hypothetical protein
MQILDGVHCAGMAQFEVNQARFLLEDLKRDIAKVASTQSESAVLELGPLCDEYVKALTCYEHLLAMTNAAQKERTQEK